jgi:hypothetical protein
MAVLYLLLSGSEPAIGRNESDGTSVISEDRESA